MPGIVASPAGGFQELITRSWQIPGLPTRPERIGKGEGGGDCINIRRELNDESGNA